MKRILHGALVSTGVLLAACGVDKDAFDESKQGLEESPAQEVPAADDGGLCSATVCFEIHIEKDISFVAAHAAACEGGAVVVSVSAIQSDGSKVPLDKEQTTVGNGYDCGGALNPSDVKVEGIDTPHAEVCVTFTGSATPGEVTVYAKAGTECHATEVSAGSCSGCDDGGEGGSGGAGGSDDGDCDSDDDGDCDGADDGGDCDSDDDGDCDGDDGGDCDGDGDDDGDCGDCDIDDDGDCDGPGDDDGRGDCDIDNDGDCDDDDSAPDDCHHDGDVACDSCGDCSCDAPC